ncbi:MAG: hypothetical protein EBX41_04100 [Chitinophagia bacterium]|nr:hypothetical protein [Chitinophagia bacterium]
MNEQPYDDFSPIVIVVSFLIILILGIGVFILIYESLGKESSNKLYRILLINKQAQLEASIKSELQERQRIGSELHDDVGASLSAAKLLLLSALAKIDNTMIGNSVQLQRALGLYDDVMVKVRALSHEMQPQGLKEAHLTEALSVFVNNLSLANDMDITLTVKQEISRLEKNVEFAVFRIIQELINNLMKHAKPKAIHLVADKVPGSAIITLMHNGDGIYQEEYKRLTHSTNTMGFKNIEGRLSVINAKINFIRLADKDYKIEITIPIQQI